LKVLLMGVEFRWQVESEEKWEGPESPSRQQRRKLWQAVGVAVLLLAVATGVAVGIFWRRACHARVLLRRELRAVVNLGAQALREGDPDLFLSLQDRDDTRWYGRQMDRVPSWYGSADLEPGQEVNLAVLDAALLPFEGRAWAEVAWALEGDVYCRVQFYRHLEGRWLRTGARREYYGGERTRQTAHFAFNYLARDEPTVNWMAEQFEAWYDAVCADASCSGGGRRINVLITPNGETGREYHPPRGFIVSSPRLRGVREDGAPLPEEREALAKVLVYLLVNRQASGMEISQQPFLLPQFVNWETRRLGLAGRDTPPTPVLNAVMACHGIEGVRAVLAAMAHTNSEDEALRQAIGVGLDGLDLVFGQYLAAMLAVERQMMEWQTSKSPVGQTSAPLARQAFNALLAQETGRGRSGMEEAFRQWPERGMAYYYPAISFNHPVVECWEMLDGSTLWAKVSYPEESEYPHSEVPEQRIEFFRQVSGAWRHIPPDERLLGEMEGLPYSLPEG
jgi:hypothetical protein